MHGVPFPPLCAAGLRHLRSIPGVDPVATIILQSLGVATFLLGTVWLGRRVGRSEAKASARRLSRVSHLLFWTCLMLPGMYGVYSPGLSRYDQLFGVPGLPWPAAAGVAGLVLLIGGLGLMIASHRALARRGRGSAAFLLTQQVVAEGIYAHSRNPMSLGFYMACVGVGLAAGSTSVTVGALAIIVPVHLFNLRYFEERELALRFGQPYLAYRMRTPFLIPRLGRHEEDR